jgi:hypothetical protein
MKTKIFLSNNIQNLEEEVNKFLIENGVTKIHAMSTDIEKNTKKFISGEEPNTSSITIIYG